MTEITSQDIRALKNADSVTFYRRADGTSGIVGHLRSDRSDTGYEQRHDVAVSSTVEVYGGRADAYQCNAWWGYSRHDAVAQTVIWSLRAGDDVSLKWTGANQSPVLDDAGLVRDELRVIVTRGKTRRVYLAAVQVGLDNTARMIRPA